MKWLLTIGVIALVLLVVVIWKLTRPTRRLGRPVVTSGTRFRHFYHLEDREGHLHPFDGTGN